MSRALLAALLLASAAAFAQTQPTPGGTPQAAPAAPAAQGTPGGAPQAAPAAPAAQGTPGDAEAIRREVDAKVEAAKKELREELRAQLATQSAAQSWNEEWTEEKRKLELFTIDGYFRVRPDLFNKFDLNREPDPNGNYLFPPSPASPRERTMVGVNMRLRLEPTLNLSEQVRVHMQVDALDNLVFGSTPEYAFTRSDRYYPYGILSESQAPPQAGINALQSSVAVKRAYGEVGTPVGILRFGRMGSNWGLGILHNDGNCLDCDYGDTVDRIQFVTEPFAGWFITPMVDINVSGPTSASSGNYGQPYPLSTSSNSTSLVLAIARRDTDQQAKAKLESGQAVFNFGVHFTYRAQKWDAVDYYTKQWQGGGGDIPNSLLGPTLVFRDSSLYEPDVWVKYEKKAYRLEAEVAAKLGTISNRSPIAAGSDNPGQNQTIYLYQFGGVAQGEYRLMDGKLKLGGEVGFASGDKAYGLGNHPGRAGSGLDGTTAPGDFDGPQYACQSTGGCTDPFIRNFQFNRDYRVDSILWRELLGPITDAIYVKPTFSYELAEGLSLYASVIYSRAVYGESTPNATDPNLGIEVNGGVRYQTEDGFILQLTYAALFPLGGLQNASPNPNALDTAQALRGIMAIKF